MEQCILPKELEKYTRNVDDRIEWDTEKFDECITDKITRKFYYIYSKKWVTMLSCVHGHTQFSNGNTDDLLLKIAADNYNLLKLQQSKLDDGMTCDFDDISGNCDAARYLIDSYFVCERCYNLIMNTHEKLVEDKSNSHYLTIYKIFNFVPDDKENVNYSGIVIKHEYYACETYIFKNYIESINIYHPKFININPDYYCYICGQPKEPEMHPYCWCSRFVSQVFTSFYFPKVYFIKWIVSTQGIDIPKDIINVILDYFNEICKIQNYTDNKALQVDDDRLIKDED